MKASREERTRCVVLTWVENWRLEAVVGFAVVVVDVVVVSVATVAVGAALAVTVGNWGSGSARSRSRWRMCDSNLESGCEGRRIWVNMSRDSRESAGRVDIH